MEVLYQGQTSIFKLPEVSSCCWRESLNSKLLKCKSCYLGSHNQFLHFKMETGIYSVGRPLLGSALQIDVKQITPH